MELKASELRIGNFVKYLVKDELSNVKYFWHPCAIDT